MDDGLRFVIYDKANVYQAEVAGLESSCDLPVNGVPTATFSLDLDDDTLPLVWADGSRCAVWFRGVERFRGRIRDTPGDSESGVVTATVEGDARKLWDWLGWPKPSAALNLQTDEYHIVTGVSETVFKTVVAANLTRLGVPWTVATTHGWGTSARAEMRFHPLADKLIPLLDQDNLILTLAHSGSGGGYGVTLDVRQAETVPGKFTLQSGVPDSYKYTREAPAATRAIVGGRGEGVARELVSVPGGAREAAWGDIIEIFVDARNTEEGSDISVEGTEALSEGAPGVGLTVELVETETFMFGVNYDVGDLIHVGIGPIDQIEQITSVTVTESAADGVLVEPRIGAADVAADVDVQLAHALTRLARGVRDQGRR